MAELPSTTQALIAQYLEAVRHDPEHHLKAANRLALYHSLGVPIIRLLSQATCYEDEPLNQNRDEVLLSHLAIITARKVLPVWESFWNKHPAYPAEMDEFQEILDLTEKIIRYQLSLKQFYSTFGDKYETGDNVTIVTPFEIGCAYLSASKAMRLVVSGSADYLELEFDDTDTDFQQHSRDFASLTALAYSSKDNSLPPGTWPWRSRKPVMEHLAINSEKRLEFWEWWLTEAISQAWQMAANLPF